MTNGPFSLRDLEHRELQSSRTGEKYSFSAVQSFRSPILSKTR